MLSAVGWDSQKRDSASLEGEVLSTAVDSKARHESPKAISDVKEYVRNRLAGTVWSTSKVAHGIYRGCMMTGQGLARVGVTPNMLTYGALLLALAAGVAVALGHFIAAAVILLLSGLCDVLDGMVARATGLTTKFGALLDSTVDRFSDALPLLGLVVYLAPYGWFAGLPAAAMLGALSISYVRARAEALGATIPPLFMRRAERLLLLAGTLAVGGIGLRIPVPHPFLVLGLAITSVLSFAAAIAALRAAHRALEPVQVEGQVRREAASAEGTPTAAESGRLRPLPIR